MDYRRCLFDGDTAEECTFYMPTIESGKMCKYEKLVVENPGTEDFCEYFICRHCDE